MYKKKMSVEEIKTNAMWVYLCGVLCKLIWNKYEQLKTVEIKRKNYRKTLDHCKFYNETVTALLMPLGYRPLPSMDSPITFISLSKAAARVAIYKLNKLPSELLILLYL